MNTQTATLSPRMRSPGPPSTVKRPFHERMAAGTLGAAGLQGLVNQAGGIRGGGRGSTLILCAAVPG
jgi:hypothetical protein